MPGDPPADVQARIANISDRFEGRGAPIAEPLLGRLLGRVHGARGTRHPQVDVLGGPEDPVALTGDTATRDSDANEVEGTPPDIVDLWQRAGSNSSGERTPRRPRTPGVSLCFSDAHPGWPGVQRERAGEVTDHRATVGLGYGPRRSWSGARPLYEYTLEAYTRRTGVVPPGHHAEPEVSPPTRTGLLDPATGLLVDTGDTNPRGKDS